MSYMQEPHWHANNRFKYSMIGPQLLDWLLTQNSLTERLKHVCDQFRVEVIRQYWGSAFLSERKQIAIPERNWVFIREVYLVCDGLPWVFARTIIPRSTVTGAEKKLLSLGNRPLGEILFEHPQMQRSEFETAIIKSGDYYFQFAASNNETVNKNFYGRRSKFLLSGKPLLVTEIFTSYFPIQEKIFI